MRNKKRDGMMLFCWLAGILMAVALITAMSVYNDLDLLKRASDEINSVAALLDSVTGLRSLMFSFSTQCLLAQENWAGALDISLGLMFLVSVLGFILLAMLVVQIKKNRQLHQRLLKIQP
tara:strand:- start:13308 stop:13667 length:360 start_codon:yes stop_codon:yes gene_type:complete